MAITRNAIPMRRPCGLVHQSVVAGQQNSSVSPKPFRDQPPQPRPFPWSGLPLSVEGNVPAISIPAGGYVTNLALRRGARVTT